jgi:hypothetical protein
MALESDGSTERKKPTDRRHWVVIDRVDLIRLSAVLLVFAALSGVLLFPFPMSSRFWNALFDLSHAPSFCVVVLILVILLDPTFLLKNKEHKVVVGMTNYLLFVMSGLVALFGAGLELVQVLVGRSPSIGDALANALGAVAACLIILSIRSGSRLCRLKRLVPSLALLIAPSINPILEIVEVYRASRELPRIASFERPREVLGWNTRTALLTQSTEWAADGKHSMKIQSIPATRYTSAVMNWPPADWRGYSGLELTLWNPQDKELRVLIHVADMQHTQTGFEPSDRLRLEVVVSAHAEKTVFVASSDVESAPANRSADLSQIAFLNVSFASKNDFQVFVDDLKLVPLSEK